MAALAIYVGLKRPPTVDVNEEVMLPTMSRPGPAREDFVVLVAAADEAVGSLPPSSSTAAFGAAGVVALSRSPIGSFGSTFDRLDLRSAGAST